MANPINRLKNLSKHRIMQVIEALDDKANSTRDLEEKYEFDYLAGVFEKYAKEVWNSKF